MSNKIDALVAKHLFGAFKDEWCGEPGHWFIPHVDGNPEHKMHLSCVDNQLRGHNVRDRDGLPKFSENRDAAWAVVEEWGVLPWNIDNGWREKNGEHISGVTCKVTTHTGSFEATEKDMPMAVCVCALRAVGVDEATIQEAMK